MSAFVTLVDYRARRRAPADIERATQEGLTKRQEGDCDGVYTGSGGKDLMVARGSDTPYKVGFLW